MSLRDVRGQKAILYFYPAAGTPGCTTQACDFRDNLASFQGARYAVVGICPDRPEELARFRDNEALTFPLLSDAAHNVHSAYGAWGEKVVNGTTVTGSLRSTFVLDEDGRVQERRSKRWRPPVTSRTCVADSVLNAEPGSTGEVRRVGGS